MKKILFTGLVMLSFVSQRMVFASLNSFPPPDPLFQPVLLSEKVEKSKKKEALSENHYRERARSFFSWNVSDKCQLRLNRVKINTHTAQKGDMIYLAPSLLAGGGEHARVRGYGIEWKIKLN